MKILSRYFLLSILIASANAENQIGKDYIGLVDDSVHLLTVKFKPEAKAKQASDGRLYFESDYSISDVASIISNFQVEFEQSLNIGDSMINQIEEGAIARQIRNGDGNAGIGLAGIFDVSSKHSNSDLLQIAQAFNALDVVEYAYLLSTNAVDSFPNSDVVPTPGLEGSQGYLGPDPGLNIQYAWSQGIYGQGVSVSDVEGGWNRDHEEWKNNPKLFKPDFPDKPTDEVFKFHGTSVVGIMFAPNNGFGVTGMVHGIDEMKLYPVGKNFELSGIRRAIAAAIAQADVGDVVIYELQTPGPEGTMMAQEIDPVVWSLNKAGSDKGVIIVAAAGNGSTDYDSNHQGMQSYRNRGDSGAIMVGASLPNLSHDIWPKSGFGSRVDVNAWGRDVTTTTVNKTKLTNLSLANDRAYTHGFNGTSSATPMVASVVVAMQSYAKQKYNTILPVDYVLQTLVTTGTAQGSGGHIGPTPNAKAAMQKIDLKFGVTKYAAQINVDSPIAVIGQNITYSAIVTEKAGLPPADYQWAFPGATPSSHVGEFPPPVSYPKKGSYPVTLTLSNSSGDEVAHTKNDIVYVNTDFEELSGTLKMNPSHRFLTLNGSYEHDRFGRNKYEQLTIYPAKTTDRVSITFQGLHLHQNKLNLDSCDLSEYKISIYDGEDRDSPLLTYVCKENESVTFTANNSSGALTVFHDPTFFSYTYGENNLAIMPWTADIYSQPNGDYCSSSSTTSHYEWIQSIILNSKPLNSVPVDSEYSDMTINNTRLTPGKSHQIDILPGALGNYVENFKVWIDFNKNGGFFDSGELVLDRVGNTWSSLSDSINIPEGLSGKTRMRISMKYQGAPSSCSNFTFGEVEDYSVTFEPDSYCPANGSDVSELFIAEVKINGKRNVSEAQSSSDFTDWVFHLKPNDENRLSISAGYFGANIPAAYKVLIDFDRDGDFDSLNETVLSRSGVTGTQTGNFSIPRHYAGITTRMRVVLADASSASSCGISGPGEVENFRVTIAAENVGAGDNVLENGDFTDGLNHWFWWQDAGGFADIYENNNEAVAEVFAGGGESWSVGLAQNGITLENGKRYKVSFRARTMFSRSIIVLAGMDHDPWTPYSNLNSILLTPLWQDYSFEFDMNHTTDNTTQLQFDLGLNDYDVFIDDVALELIP